MNIPFYRYVEYADDGHYIYQCLNCGKKIDVGYTHFSYNPRFCSFCGVEYKGFILPKNIKYVSYQREEIKYIIQKGWTNNFRDLEDWEDWITCDNLKIAIQCLKELRDYNKYDNKKSSGKWTERIILKKEKQYYYTEVDVDKYYLKTGKKFNTNK